MDALITTLLVVSLFVLLGSGVWIGLALAGVAWIGMELFSSRPAGDAMAVTIWGSASSWTLTALPLFVWMGEILFRTRLSEDMFRGLAPWLERLPGRLLHTNIIGCTIFAAVSGSSAATCATIGKMTLPELKARGYPEDMTIGTLAGAGTLGLLIPPSIIMIVYGVMANVSIAQLFIAGVHPGHPARVALLRLHRRLGAAASRADPGRGDDDDARAEALRVAPPDSDRAADRARAGLDLRGDRDRDRGGRVRRRGLARDLRGAGLAVPRDVRREHHGRDAPLLHDRADPRRRVVPHARDGLHRPAAASRRMDRRRSGSRRSRSSSR